MTRIRITIAMTNSSPGQPQTNEASADLDRPSLFLNRELSWLQFNLRVLEEAENTRHPLLERVQYLAIFAPNLDEFFMIRVSGVRRRVAQAPVGRSPDGVRRSQQMRGVSHDLAHHAGKRKH